LRAENQATRVAQSTVLQILKEKNSTDADDTATTLSAMTAHTAVQDRQQQRLMISKPYSDQLGWAVATVTTPAVATITTPAVATVAPAVAIEAEVEEAVLVVVMAVAVVVAVAIAIAIATEPTTPEVTDQLI
jgi:hypothetical protein